MRVVTAPEIWEGVLRQTDEVGVFIGGGITNCPDWQDEMCVQLDTPNSKIVALNPRRPDFPMDDPDAAEQQIIWERLHIDAANIMAFWFPEETLCPITLFELGTELRSNKKLFVGTHPNYKRRSDVIIQSRLLQPRLVIRDNIKDVADDIVMWTDRNVGMTING